MALEDYGETFPDLLQQTRTNTWLVPLQPTVLEYRNSLSQMRESELPPLIWLACY